MKTLAYWNSPNIGATNSSGFNSVPGGVRYENGYFDYIGYSSNYWTASKNLISNAYFINNVAVNTVIFHGNFGNFNWGLSVRCIKE